MNTTLPITRELLLIGGGHTHALVLRMWGMNPLPGVRVTVLNPAPTAAYSGMLPGFVAGHYRREELDIDLVRLARFANARLILGRATGIDTANRVVALDNGRALHYHIASLDVGVTSDLPELPGFSAHGNPAKPLDGLAHAWADFRTAVAAGAALPKAAVIGGGVAGVELALAMAHALRTTGKDGVEVNLIERRNILNTLEKLSRCVVLRNLDDCRISVLENADVTALEHGRAILQDGRIVAADFIVGAASARPHDWLGETGLDTAKGFVDVDKTLRSTNVPEIFAVGDCARMGHAPRPKAGVFAVRQAPVLYANLRAALSGGAMQKFRPQKQYLKLISLGEKSALADKWGLRLSGAAVWRLKDRIDRKFMDQFHNLRPMAAPALPKMRAQGIDQAPEPLCGGCGAKIGGVALSKVLGGLRGAERGDVLSTIGDDAATLSGPAGQYQVISTDHLRGFWHDPGLMARIAAIHSLGDIWAMGAKPQAALATLILPRLSPELQRMWMAEIMACANEVFAAEGATIVGGHSSLGAELTIGFTVTGLRDGTPVGLGGARAGDQLILTKPIGTGTIMAAEMAMRARAKWVIGALNSMARGQGEVAEVLAGANAMTDVTGFGLAGHLAGIAKASGVGIELILADIPVLDGAVELAEQGIRSSIYEDNRALVPGFELPDEPKAELLFDPQTAGGLVAAVPGDLVPAILRKLNNLDCNSHVIGHCVDQPPGLRII
ncbi:MAG: selenide, water dikinase SelD [Paracoccaceae bacterium]